MDPSPTGFTVVMTPAVRLLEVEGVVFGVHEYERGEERRDFGREAADALGLDPDQVFKTLLVDVEGVDHAAPSGPGRGPAAHAPVTSTVCVIVPVSCMVSMKGVAAAVGAKRATMCDPADAERSTGYVVGGISPFGQRRRLTTVCDESVELFETVYVSGGRRGMDVSVAPADLVRLLDAAVAPITS